MYRLAVLLGLVGLAVATGVIVWSGWQPVMQALAQAGWGIPLIALVHLLSLAISSAGWRLVTPPLKSDAKPSYPMFFYFMWVRGSVNNLMPVARIGGEFAAVRLMIAHGIDSASAIAGTVVELTLSVAAVALFVASGAVAFSLQVSNHAMTVQLGAGVFISVLLLAALGTVQKFGFFGLLSKLVNLMFRDKWASLAGNAGRLDRAVTDIYLSKTGPALCGLLQILAWVSGTLEIYLSLKFLGHPLPLAQAYMIEALIQATSSAGFAIPGALGLQEAGFLLFGAMLGLPHDIAAAMAVMRRCRDLLCYVPGLIVWQMHEGRRLLGSDRRNK
jgi:putative membrane protein